MGVRTGRGTDVEVSHDGIGRHSRRTPRSLFSRDLILVRRDPRDVLVSNWFSVVKRTKLIQIGLDRFACHKRWGVRRMLAWYRRWDVRLHHWRRLRRAHVWTYEQAIRDRLHEFTSLAKFLGLDNQRVVCAVESSSFDRMKESERTRDGLLFPEIKQPTNLDDPETYIVRNGVIGDWRYEMSSETQTYVNEHLCDLPGFMARYREPEDPSEYFATFMKQLVDSGAMPDVVRGMMVSLAEPLPMARMVHEQFRKKK
jgi:hypothetical protein